MAIVKKYLSKDKTIRIATIVSTDLVQDAIVNQEVSALSVIAMGRLLTGTVLMASQLNENQQVGAYLKGDGPLDTLFAEASYEGICRSYCANRQAELPEGSKSIGSGIGKGVLEVVRDIPFQKEPHRGTVAIQSGEIGDDLAYYLRQSHQVPAIVALSVLPNEKGCEAAGGYIIELMPGYDDDTIDLLERIQSQVPPISELVKKGAEAADLVADFLLNIEFEELTHPHQVKFQCRCSMERMERSLITLGVEELKSLVSTNEILKVTCEFCGKPYDVNPIQIQRLLKSLRSH